jgi:hypothetical protein
VWITHEPSYNVADPSSVLKPIFRAQRRADLFRLPKAPPPAERSDGFSGPEAPESECGNHGCHFKFGLERTDSRDIIVSLKEGYMRYAKPVLLLLGLSTALVAADPFAGTWKLNPAKSKYKTGTPAKEQTVVITEAGGDLDVNITGTAADGSAIASHYTMPAKGGTGKIIQSPYDAISSKRPSDNERVISYSKGGKVVYTARPRLSADSKTMTATVNGTDPAGKPVEGTAVFEKQ